MDINVTENEKNEALDREEVKLNITHSEESTPKRSEVRAKLAAEQGVKEELIIINELHTDYGNSETKGYVKIYDDKERLEEIENKYTIERNLGEDNG
ncbi:30S ribosomal protein S24e [archaeon SCG-AAA382B04]|nr:30S ribosomal protein S24e [archaeon SCG-AAA382B04]